MVEAEKYTKGFFEELETNSYLSAKKVLPIVYNLIKPISVIDIGCGTGEWLKVWNEDIGITDIKGVEGPYIKKELVKIANEKLTIFDLKNVYSEPRKYDLAMSLEVGEHLPTECSINLVKTLTQLSNVVLFSAALPGQEGTYHINEQYPEFWAALFLQFNFLPVDCIREKIWHTDGIEYWYKQNTILYIHESILPNYPALKKNSENVQANYLFRLHPNLYKLKLQRIKETSTLLGLLNWKWVRFKYKFLKKNA
jgi:SAM-dependent methyltransferase